MLERVITGGQTGADQGGWRAARCAGIPTSGWMPRGYLTEDGPRPDFGRDCGAREHESERPDDRTVANVHHADATFVFAGPEPSAGTLTTVSACRQVQRPYLIIAARSPAITPERTAQWLRRHDVRCLNVAGDRESQTPGIGSFVEAFLAQVFQELQVSSRPAR